MASPVLRWIPLLPLAGFVLATFAGPRLGRRGVSWVAPGLVGASFVLTLVALARLVGAPEHALVDRVYTWIGVGPLAAEVAFRFDALTAVMALVVTGVGFVIHVYSVGYMGEDRDVFRYFAYLNLFTAMMLVLVMADNLLLLFVGWEGVGLCSYLLIGFWYGDLVNASAGKKAFVVNRVGDAGFLIGLFLLFWAAAAAGRASFRIADLAAAAPALGTPVVTAVALLLFVGCTGKSAQFPLYVWLPDAMAGPTPVSALIHAATMVTAGVYLIGRLHVVYSEAAPVALAVVAGVGAFTAVGAATIALVQTDIKRVLAYSTVSQIGYMFLGMGVGAFGAGLFHLVTHAFFKALLFLGAGSVMHALGGEQDLRRMGGLRRHLPFTYPTFVVASAALAGIPGFSGFFSKDEILLAAYDHSPYGRVLWAAGLIGAGLTAFYISRLVFLAFWGEPRSEKHPHESPPVMTVPLLVLAVGAALAGYLGLPSGWAWGNRFAEFLGPVFGPPHHDAEGLGVMAASTLVALVGVGAAYVVYVARPDLPALLAERFARVYRVLLGKYYVDELYEASVVRPTVGGAGWLARVWDAAVIDGAVNGAAATVALTSGLWRRVQSGNVQHYALIFLGGVAALLGYMAWGG